MSDRGAVPRQNDPLPTRRSVTAPVMYTEGNHQEDPPELPRDG